MKKGFYTNALICLVVLASMSACKKQNLEDLNSQASSESLVPLETKNLFPGVDTFNIEIDGYCPAQNRDFVEIFAANYSHEVYNGNVHADTDKDGLSDEQDNDQQMNILPSRYDTNLDMFSDYLMVLAGIDPTQQNKLICQDSVTLDDDGDGTFFFQNGQEMFVGLNNCEEKKVTHTDQTLFDTDNDTIPDYLELRCGLNPLDKNDALMDTDSDGISNLDECKKGTPNTENNNDSSLKYLEIQYAFEMDAQLNNGCGKFRISNIPILNGGNDNLVSLQLIERDGFQKNHLITATVYLQGGGQQGKTVKINYSTGLNGTFLEK